MRASSLISFRFDSSIATISHRRRRSDRARLDDAEYVIGSEEISNEYGIKLVSTPLKFLSIDVADLDRRVGIEVDGPGHFVNVLDNVLDDDDNADNTAAVPDNNASANTDGRMKRIQDSKMWLFDSHSRRRINGSTALKQHLLTQLGWRIVNVLFWEWNALNNNEDGQNEYCEGMLSWIVGTNES